MKTSDIFTSSKSIMTKGGVYYGCSVSGRGGGLNQLSLHHNPSGAQGQIVDEAIIVSGDYYHSYFEQGITLTSGLYAQVEGNVRAVCWYQENALQGN